MKPISSFRHSALAALLLLSLGTAHAQSSAARDGLSDAERAKRDAEKVFSFIKFSTVKPAAAAPAPAAAAAAATGSKPSAAALAAQAAPAAVRAAASPATQAAALAAVQAATTPPATTSTSTGGSQAAAPAASAPATVAQPAEALAQAATATPVVAPVSAATAAPAIATGAVAATALPAAASTQPVPEEPEEVPLKLIAYTAPEMNQRVLSALGDRRIVVPVRFKVEANGIVSSAQAMGSAPRVLELSATRAVQQWKFDKLPASREVDVEIAFKAGD